MPFDQLSKMRKNIFKNSLNSLYKIHEQLILFFFPQRAEVFCSLLVKSFLDYDGSKNSSVLDLNDTLCYL